MKSFRIECLLGLAILVVTAVPAHATVLVPASGAGAMAQATFAPGGSEFSVSDVPMNVLSTELKLTSNQQSAIGQIVDQLAIDRKALTPDPANLPDPNTMQQNMEKLNSLMETANKSIMANLSGDQSQALKPLLTNLEDFQTVDLPIEIYSDLNLSNEQKSKIAAIASAVRAQREDSMNQARNETDINTLREAMDQAQADMTAKVKAVLTDSQNARVDQYKKDHPQSQFTEMAISTNDGGHSQGAP